MAEVSSSAYGYLVITPLELGHRMAEVLTHYGYLVITL